jgi:hypothetical protein
VPYFQAFNSQDPITDFSSFLMDEIYWRDRGYYDFGPDGPCLLDVIALWVASGDATRVCGTFENYVVGVIAIINDWLEHDRTAIAAVPVWPENRERFEDQQGAAVAQIAHGSLGNGEPTIYHQALNRTWWESIRFAKQERERSQAEQA